MKSRRSNFPAIFFPGFKLGKRTRHSFKLLKWILTSWGEEYFDGRVLEQVAAGKDGSDLGEVPFSMKMVRILQDLKRNRRTILLENIQWNSVARPFPGLLSSILSSLNQMTAQVTTSIFETSEKNSDKDLSSASKMNHEKRWRESFFDKFQFKALSSDESYTLFFLWFIFKKNPNELVRFRDHISCLTNRKCFKTNTEDSWNKLMEFSPIQMAQAEALN